MTVQLADGWESMAMQITPSEAALIARIGDGDVDADRLGSEERGAVLRWIAHGIVVEVGE